MNRTLTILRYASIPGKGWRRGACVLTKNGKLKPNAVIIGGREVDAPSGRYHLRRYHGTRAVYTELGTDPSDALSRFRAEEAKVKAHVAAVAAGLEVLTDDQK